MIKGNKMGASIAKVIGVGVTIGSALKNITIVTAIGMKFGFAFGTALITNEIPKK